MLRLISSAYALDTITTTIRTVINTNMIHATDFLERVKDARMAKYDEQVEMGEKLIAIIADALRKRTTSDAVECKMRVSLMNGLETNAITRDTVMESMNTYGYKIEFAIAKLETGIHDTPRSTYLVMTISPVLD